MQKKKKGIKNIGGEKTASPASGKKADISKGGDIMESTMSTLSKGPSRIGVFLPSHRKANVWGLGKDRTKCYHWEAKKKETTDFSGSFSSFLW